MSTHDEKTIKPVPASKQMSIARVISAGYEQQSNTEDPKNPQLPSPSDAKTRLNLSAKPYKPKDAKVPSLVQTNQSFLPKAYNSGYQPLSKPICHP